MRSITLFVIAISLVHPIYSQNFELVKEDLGNMAIAAFDDGQYAESGTLYEQAYEQSNKVNSNQWKYYALGAAQSFSLTNNTSKAIKFLSIILEEGFYGISDVIINPTIDNIRKSPQYTLLMEKFKKPNTIYVDDFLMMLFEESEDSVVYIENKNIMLNIKSYGKPNENYKAFIANNFKNAIYDSGRLKIYKYIEIVDCNISNLLLRDLDILSIDIMYSTIRNIHIENVHAKSIGFESNEAGSNEDYVRWMTIKDSKTDNLFISRNHSNITLINLDVHFDFDLVDNTCKIVYIKNSNFNFGNTASISGEVGKLRISNSKFSEVPLGIYKEQRDSEFSLNPLPEANGNLLIGINSESLEIKNCDFDCDVIISPASISKSVEIQENSFNGYFDPYLANLPEFNKYMPFNQFNKGLATFNFVSGEDSPDGANCYFCLRYTGLDNGDIENTESFNRLIQANQTLYNHYRQVGDIISSNTLYVTIKDLYMNRMAYIYIKDGGFRNLFRYKLAQVMKFYTNHGTDPSLALLISFYIILIFAIFYFFFPSEWDTTSKARLISNFKEFRQKNDKGYIKPFFVLLGGFSISLINALTLSLNSFVTLGFGTIPTTGLARYVCIIQGFIGWFLLSIFTVALINQVLA